MNFLLMIMTCLIFCSTGLAKDQNNTGGYPTTNGEFRQNNFKGPDEIDVTNYPNIVITLTNKKTYNCHLDTISKYYICPNKKSPFLVHNSFAGFLALGKDEGKSTRTLAITNVKSGNTVLSDVGNNSWPRPEGALDPLPDLKGESSETLNSIDTFLNLWELGEKKSVLVNGSDEFNKIAQDLIKEKNILLENAKKISESVNFEVELEDGQKINCARENKRVFSGELEKIYKNYECGSFKCDPVTINGEQFQSSMIFDSSPGSTTGGSIHLLNKDKIAPEINIKKISSPLSSLPIVDYSSWINNRKLPVFNQPIPMSSEMMAAYGIREPLPEVLPENLEKIKSKIKFYQDPYLNIALSAYQNICTDERGSMANTLAAKDAVSNEITRTKMTQLIAVLSDGSLFAQYIDPNQAGKYGCFYQGAYLNEAAAKNLDKIKKNINPDDNVGETISLERADQLFKKAQNMKDIAWNYIEDGCYARAHLMARRFESEGVRVDKVWIKGDLFVPETVPEISWNFHVAPIVYVQDKKGKTTKMVIDPSLFDHPVTVEEWDQKMSKRTKLGSFITRFPFPENALAMQRSTLAFSSSDPYMPGDNISMSEEDKLSAANNTMAKFIKIPKYQPMPTQLEKKQ